MKIKLSSFSSIFFKFVSVIIPGKILYRFLRIVAKSKLKFLVAQFDPNNIRKKTSYKLKPKILDIYGDNWILSVNVNDHIGFKTFVNNSPFEMSLYNLCNQLKINENDIILDIGANIGTASVPICAMKKTELIAIEPSKENANLLSKNISQNNLRAQVHTYALTDDSSSEYIKFYIQTGNTGANSIFKSWNPGVEQERIFELVKSITLDQLSKNINLDYDRLKIVKIDVEGAEEKVLRGGYNFLKLNNAPIIFEYRKDATQKYINSQLKELVKILNNHNYKLFSLINNKIDLFNSESSYENVLAIKENSPSSHLLLN